MYGKFVVLAIAASCLALANGDGHEGDHSAHDHSVNECYKGLQGCTDWFSTMPHDNWDSYNNYYMCLDGVTCSMDRDAEGKRKSMMAEVQYVMDTWGMQWGEDSAQFTKISLVSLVACLSFSFVWATLGLKPAVY